MRVVYPIVRVVAMVALTIEAVWIFTLGRYGSVVMLLLMVAMLGYEAYNDRRIAQLEKLLGR